LKTTVLTVFSQCFLCFCAMFSRIAKGKNGEGAEPVGELHAFPENKGQDYSSFNEIIKRETGATTRVEYALTLDMAKELAMVGGKEKGRQARRYFIECEKMLREVSPHRPIGAGKVLEALGIFNAGMQAAMSMDMWKSVASSRANQLALEHTGVDILKGMGIADGENGPRSPSRMLH